MPDPYKKQALRDWSYEYPRILDARVADDGYTQHLLKRAIFQSDEDAHWFCGCDEFHWALQSQQSGCLSNIAKQQPLRCKHIDLIMKTDELKENKVELCQMIEQ